MRSLLRGVVGLVAGGVLLGAALGAWGGSEPDPASPGAGAAAVTVRGVVTAVNDGAFSVEIQEGDRAAEMLVALDEKTVVLKQRKRIAGNEIRVGDPVTVRYTERDGRAIARHVWVRVAGDAAAGTGKTQ